MSQRPLGAQASTSSWESRHANPLLSSMETKSARVIPFKRRILGCLTEISICLSVRLPTHSWADLVRGAKPRRQSPSPVAWTIQAREVKPKRQDFGQIPPRHQPSTMKPCVCRVYLPSLSNSTSPPQNPVYAECICHLFPTPPALHNETLLRLQRCPIRQWAVASQWLKCFSFMGQQTVDCVVKCTQ